MIDAATSNQLNIHSSWCSFSVIRLCIWSYLGYFDHSCCSHLIRIKYTIVISVSNRVYMWSVAREAPPYNVYYHLPIPSFKVVICCNTEAFPPLINNVLTKANGMQFRTGRVLTNLPFSNWGITHIAQHSGDKRSSRAAILPS